MTSSVPSPGAPTPPDGVRVAASVQATYDSARDGLPYHVTTQVGDRTVTFQAPIADPFVRTTAVVGWRDALRELIRHRGVRVVVTVGGDRERVHDVLELDDQQLIVGRSRHAAFHAHISERLAVVPDVETCGHVWAQAGWDDWQHCRLCGYERPATQEPSR